MTLRFLAAAISLGAVVWAHGAPASGQFASSGIVTSAHVIPAWYATARTAPASPVQLSRVLAMVLAAMHDAVNGAEPRYETYASDLIDSRAHPEAAAAGAAHRVLSGLFPALQASWDAALVESLSAIPDGRAEAFGVKLGAAVGQVILNVRADDGWNTVDPFNPEPEPGIWKPTPPAFLPMSEPQFQNVTPFTLESRAQFWLAPPPALTARDYQRVFDEVKSIGQDTSATRTADQTHIAHFWFEPPYDSWSRIAGILQSDKGYDLHQTARLYALVNMVVADGLVSGWYWKRQYAFWRPITAIREADLDGNPATGADPAWQPLRATPSHPDHPSTHSVTGGAAAEVIRSVGGIRPSPILHDDAHGDAVWINALLRDLLCKRRTRTRARGCMRASTSAPRFRQAIAWDVGSGASRSNTRFALCGAAIHAKTTTRSPTQTASSNC